ncbi:MAG: hypothetical protein RL701_2563 [Pseudomonadota bacterium]
MHPQDRLFCEIAVQLSLLTREQVARCLKTQQREEAGKTIATLAVALGFMNQAAVENVMQQQQRLLERRREARNASTVQRETESRLATSPQAGNNTNNNSSGGKHEEVGRPAYPSGSGNAPVRPARRDPTPTSRWVYSEAPAQNRLRNEDSVPNADFLGSDELDSAGIHETLDVRPPGRLSGRAVPRESTPAAEPAPAPRNTLPIERPSLTPAVGHNVNAADPQAARNLMLPPSAARTQPGTSAPGQRTVAGMSPAAPPSSAARPAAAAPTRSATPTPVQHAAMPAGVVRPAGPVARTLPAGRAAELRSPTFTGAATSGPLPPPMPSPAAHAGMRGTLLETSGREQQRHDQPRGPAPERAASRPVPLGRDWRNPSRPPPPSVGLALELGATSTLPPAAADAAANLSEDAPQYVERALELCVQAGGSDVLLHPGSPPCLRIDGQLRPWNAQQPLAAASTERYLSEILSEEQRMQLSLDTEMHHVSELPNGLRVRSHVYLSELGWNLVLRTLTREMPVPERLGLGAVVRALRDAPRGLCICSGPSGAGKTTTLWALAHALASERALHVVSLEGPTEMVFADGIGLFEQREVGRHVASYADGIAWAAAQAADVIVVADLLAPEALAACLRASRAGCLVLAGMRASSSQKALTRLLNQPSLAVEPVRTELAHALRLLLHQRLVPRANVPGRVAGIEQVVNTPQVAQLIRDDQLQQLTATLAASKNAGTISLEDALEDLVRSATITSEVRTTTLAAARSGARLHGN